MQAERATWQCNHVRAEAERQVRSHAAVPHFLVDEFVDDVVARVLSPELSVSLTPRREIVEPAELRPFGRLIRVRDRWVAAVQLDRDPRRRAARTRPCRPLRRPRC